MTYIDAKADAINKSNNTGMVIFIYEDQYNSKTFTVSTVTGEPPTEESCIVSAVHPDHAVIPLTRYAMFLDNEIRLGKTV